jgi:hypothetical protein
LLNKPATERTTAELVTAYADGQRDLSGWSIASGVLVRETFEGCTFDLARFRECAGAFSEFVNCSFAGAEFLHCILDGVDFLSSALEGVSVTTCVMDRCDYFRSTLRGSRFVSSSMRNSCFVHTNLSDSQFESTSLSGSIFGATALTGNMLLGPDFSDVVVALPHSISRAELKRLQEMAYVLSMMSSGPVPQGMPPATSEYARTKCTLLPGAVDFLERGGVASDDLLPLRDVIDRTLPHPASTVFLSYATEDEAFAQLLATLLARSGLEVWFAPRSMRGGQKLYDQLMREVDRRDRLVLVVSKAAIGSNWVLTELRRAVRLPAQKGSWRRVVPVLLIDDDQWRAWKLIDSDSGRDLALELRSGRSYSFAGAPSADTVASTVKALLGELTDHEGGIPG